MKTELIRKDDALHAVLHNQGDAAVAAVQAIKPINPHGELREMLIDEMIDRANRPMNNAELIKALRETDFGYVCEHCEHEDMCRNNDCVIIQAADALEAADEMIADCVAAIDALDDSNDAYIKENERLKKRIAELEAQLPKEGEWMRTDAFPHRIYCSVCYKTYVPNDRWQIWVDDELPKNYCPFCGAKMIGGKDD